MTNLKERTNEPRIQVVELLLLCEAPVLAVAFAMFLLLAPTSFLQKDLNVSLQCLVQYSGTRTKTRSESDTGMWNDYQIRLLAFANHEVYLTEPGQLSGRLYQLLSVAVYSGIFNHVRHHVRPSGPVETSGDNPLSPTHEHDLLYCISRPPDSLHLQQVMYIYSCRGKLIE